MHHRYVNVLYINHQRCWMSHCEHSEANLARSVISVRLDNHPSNAKLLR